MQVRGSVARDVDGWMRETEAKAFALTKCTNYLYSLSANPDDSFTKSMVVTIGPVGGSMTTLGTYSLASGTRTHANMQWLDMTTPNFTAQDGVTYRLQFSSLTSGGKGLALDNIQLVPEPSSLAMGCAGLVLFRLLKRKSSARNSVE